LGIITTPLICLGIITVLIFGDYYVAFWGLLLCSISGIIQATQNVLFKRLMRCFLHGRLIAQEAYCTGGLFAHYNSKAWIQTPELKALELFFKCKKLPKKVLGNYPLIL
jgi:hypothetical protein